MSDSGLFCSVYVNGVRLADTADAYAAGTPTVLAGLSHVWGRANVIDQPDTSSCTFDVVDVGGDTSDLFDLLHVGYQVDVYAGGTVAPTPADVAIDGGFESTTDPAARVTVVGGTAYVDTAEVADGSRSLAVQSSSTSTPAVVHIPPAPYPADWSDLPVLSVGEVWSVAVKTHGDYAGTGSVALGLWPASKPTTAATTHAPTPVTFDAGWTTTTVTWTADATIGATDRAGAVVTVTPAIAWTVAAGTWLDQITDWRTFGATRIDTMTVTAPAQSRKRVLVFTGRVTDLSAVGYADGAQMSVIAVDTTADLANCYIGDQPWLAQTLSARVAQIRKLSTVPFVTTVDSGVGAYTVSWRDVDSQPVTTLLSELAVTGDAVLWSAFSTAKGFYLWYEDPATRSALNTLTLSGGVVIIVGSARIAGGVILSACDVLKNPVTYTEDVNDVVTRVDLTWLAQTLDDKGQPAPTETHVLVAVPDAESTYGVRRVGYSTQLTTSADGTTVANRVLARSYALGWHASGFVWDTRAPAGWTQTNRDTALTLLDGVERIGLPVTLTDLPEWAPGSPTSSVYVEGGTYAFDAGRWTLELAVSPAGVVKTSIHWNQIDPTYLWNQFDPAIAWLDMGTVGPSGGLRSTPVGDDTTGGWSHGIMATANGA